MVIVPQRTTAGKSQKARARQRELLQRRRRRILNRIAHRPEPEREVPMFTAANIHYELGERVQGLAPGGIGALLLLARRTGLIAAIDHDLHLLKRHLHIGPNGTERQNRLSKEVRDRWPNIE